MPPVLRNPRLSELLTSTVVLQGETPESMIASCPVRRRKEAGLAPASSQTRRKPGQPPPLYAPVCCMVVASETAA